MLSLIQPSLMQQIDFYLINYIALQESLILTKYSEIYLYFGSIFNRPGVGRAIL